MSNLFKYVREIQSIDDGYALRFHRSDDPNDLEELIGKIANYIIFESRNAPQLTFSIVGERHTKAFWLQVRSLAGDASDRASAYVPPDSFWSSLGKV